MQSDGQSPANPDALIAVDVPAGPEYLEVENLGGASDLHLDDLLDASPIPPSHFRRPRSTLRPIQTAIVSADLHRRRADRPGRRQRLLRYGVGVPGQRRRHLPAPGELRGGVRSGGPRDRRLHRRRSDRPGRGQLRLTSNVSVLLGNGDGTFQPQVTYAVGSWPDAIVAGDFNGDGRTDLAVANFDSNDVSVLLGNGDGTFRPQVSYPVGSQPVALVTGDFTGDGRTDLAVANAAPTTCRCSWARATARFSPRYLSVGSWARYPRDGRLQRRRADRPGRPHPERHDLAIHHRSRCRCSWATATAPSRPR